ncbi:methyltransferase domain-containing protein [candidate division GN15 bacterium]|nr:methyltransferase domain-containing protein [candidate division GN15 bacterium]
MPTFDDRLAELSGGVVLDVGTGRGQFASGLAKELKDYTEIIGVDSSEAAITEARDKIAIDRVRFELMDAEHLQFASESFDTVAMSNSLHHLPEPDIVLSEMKRVLKPGGVMIVVEMFCDNQSETQMSHVLVHHWWAEIDILRGVYHRESYTRQQILGFIDRLEMKKTEVYDYIERDDNPHDPERIKMIDDLVVEYFDKIPDGPEREDLRRRGEEIRQRLQTTGFSWATCACVLAWK